MKNPNKRARGEEVEGVAYTKRESKGGMIKD
jgi:hypothetical protein